VLAGDRRVGFVTSGAYGHHVRQSLALAYVDEELAREPKPLRVDVVGISREARILAEPPYDPRGLNVRA
jgi:dimethylglycine dehydrogenase